MKLLVMLFKVGGKKLKELKKKLLKKNYKLYYSVQEGCYIIESLSRDLNILERKRDNSILLITQGIYLTNLDEYQTKLLFKIKLQEYNDFINLSELIDFLDKEIVVTKLGIILGLRKNLEFLSLGNFLNFYRLGFSINGVLQNNIIGLLNLFKFLFFFWSLSVRGINKHLK